MVKYPFFAELSSSNLSYKDKKEIVLNHRQRVIDSLMHATEAWRKIEDAWYKIDSLRDEYWEARRKRIAAESQLKWLKNLPKRRALKYALVYHWSFTQR